MDKGLYPALGLMLIHAADDNNDALFDLALFFAVFNVLQILILAGLLMRAIMGGLLIFEDTPLEMILASVGRALARGGDLRLSSHNPRWLRIFLIISEPFFNEDGIDPVELATGNRQPLTEDNDTSSAKDAKTGMPTKKKAGFYLSRELFERFNYKFYELKLAGIAIDNKSTLLELALTFALDDLDKGARNLVLQSLCSR